uniref:F-box n=1 Tax=Solanum tuberosum TaxID=4113 RepID=M0ZY92_SOLTU
MEAEAHHTQIPSTSSKDSFLAIPTLPQELITAILVRLPVKYLLQFKCVSKNWFALISSPHFVKTHLSFSGKDRFLLEIDTYILKHCSVSSLFYDSVTEAFNLVYPIKGNKGIVGMEYGVKESWTKLYSIKCYLYELSPPLYMSIEGEILHVLETNLTIYNPEDDSMRYPVVTNAFGILEVTTLYIESLVSRVLQNESMTQH